MPATLNRPKSRPLKEAITTKTNSAAKDEFIKYFFAASASVSILVLFLIMLSLFSQSVGFNPVQGFFGQNYRNLLVHRQAGLEFVDIIKKETDKIDSLNQRIADARLAELRRQITKQIKAGKNEDDALAAANAALAPFDEFAGKLSNLDSGLEEIIGNLSETAMNTKSAIKVVEDKKTEKQMYLNAGKTDLADKVVIQDVDLEAAVKPMKDALPALAQANTAFAAALEDLAKVPPPTLGLSMKLHLIGLDLSLRNLAGRVPTYQKRLEAWDPQTPLPWYAGVTDFFFNTQWLTASSWQDYYGIVPLLVGSLLISFVALVIAVPLGVGAGVYINQIATPLEQNTIKPAIEFISAIPSVVLGFFGIAILGDSMRGYSQHGLLYFLPEEWIKTMPQGLHDFLGYSIIPPFTERLNIMTAGILLAFMAVPTIFTLTEDALNNVPRSFKEASYALGANRLQTIWRIILPASLSGVISAVLLGFGRVIGETMVVLLCAGNSISIPPLSKGLMIVFQPVHTMTGIIAQELGEAENGSIEWRALFMVGLMLFVISLFINFFAQRVVQRYKISVG